MGRPTHRSSQTLSAFSLFHTREILIDISPPPKPHDRPPDVQLGCSGISDPFGLSVLRLSRNIAYGSPDISQAICPRYYTTEEEDTYEKYNLII